MGRINMSEVHAVPQTIEKPQEKENFRIEKTTNFIPEESSNEPPLSVYENIKGEPFSVRYFDLREWFSLIQNPHFDVSGLKDKIATIENYVKESIGKRGLLDSTESYASIITDLKTKLKIHALEKPSLVFEKIYRYLSRARGRSAFKK